MPNLRGASPVSRDVGGRSYAAHGAGELQSRMRLISRKSGEILDADMASRWASDSPLKGHSSVECKWGHEVGVRRRKGGM